MPFLISFSTLANILTRFADQLIFKAKTGRCQNLKILFPIFLFTVVWIRFFLVNEKQNTLSDLRLKRIKTFSTNPSLVWRRFHFLEHCCNASSGFCAKTISSLNYINSPYWLWTCFECKCFILFLEKTLFRILNVAYTIIIKGSQMLYCVFWTGASTV